MSAEGGEFGFKDPDLDYNIDHDGGDDLQEVDKTQPFKPGASSTPYHRGEQVKMQTMQHEESGGRSYYEETDFGGNDRTPLLSATDSNIEEALHNLQSGEGPGILEILKRDQYTGAVNQKVTPIPNVAALPVEIRRDIIERAKRFISYRFPNARLESLVFVFHKNNPIDLLVRGPGGKKGYPVFLKNGSDFQQSFLNLKFVKYTLKIKRQRKNKNWI